MIFFCWVFFFFVSFFHENLFVSCCFFLPFSFCFDLFPQNISFLLSHSFCFSTFLKKKSLFSLFSILLIFDISFVKTKTLCSNFHFYFPHSFRFFFSFLCLLILTLFMFPYPPDVRSLFLSTLLTFTLLYFLLNTFFSVNTLSVFFLFSERLSSFIQSPFSFSLFISFGELRLVFLLLFDVLFSFCYFSILFLNKEHPFLTSQNLFLLNSFFFKKKKFSKKMLFHHLVSFANFVEKNVLNVWEKIVKRRRDKK